MSKQKNDNYFPDYLALPGETLAETLDELGMSQVELSKRISRPEKTISEIINGHKTITPDTAIQLERALDVPASFWNNLEKNYQELRARLQSRSDLVSEVEIAKKYPYSHMADLHWVEPASTPQEKAENLLLFFGVNSLSSVDTVMPIALRKHNGSGGSRYSIQAWLRKGEIESRKIKTKPFNREKILKNISIFKTLSLKKPKEFNHELVQNLADCGVVLIFTHDLPSTQICGSARWLTVNKATIQLSLRGKYADIMCFTLFHELAHILVHSKKKYFVDFVNSKNSPKEDEAEADKFAAEKLISSEALSSFIKTGPITELKIRAFAEKLEIHPGIIVGRLQHDRIINFNQLNHLRVKYAFVET